MSNQKAECIDNENNHKLIGSKDEKCIETDVGHPNLPKKCNVRLCQHINSIKTMQDRNIPRNGHTAWENPKKHEKIQKSTEL